MAARRLVIVMLVLLGISALAAALVPGQRVNQGTDTTDSTATGETTEVLPEGRLLTATINAARTKQQAVRIKLGDELILLVKANLRDDVEIPALGVVEPVDPLTPARFDLLPTQTGSYPVRLVTEHRRVGRLQVLARKSKKKPKEPAKPKSRARGEPAPG